MMIIIAEVVNLVVLLCLVLVFLKIKRNGEPDEGDSVGDGSVMTVL